MATVDATSLPSILVYVQTADTITCQHARRKFAPQTNCTTVGGHLLNRELLVKGCEYDPLPLFRLVFAQIAASCKSLSESINFAGKREVRCSFPSLTN